VRQHPHGCRRPPVCRTHPERPIRASDVATSIAAVSEPPLDSRSSPFGYDKGRFGREQPTRRGEAMEQPVNPDERDPSVTTVAAISLGRYSAPRRRRRPGRRHARGRPRRPGPSAGLVRRAAVLAMAAGPRRLEPGHRRRDAGVSPITTRPSGRGQPCRRDRLRPGDRRSAPRPPPLTGTRPSALLMRDSPALAVLIDTPPSHRGARFGECFIVASSYPRRRFPERPADPQ
jgi:hypothetical protein